MYKSDIVPGMRTQPAFDPTRTIACAQKNSLIYRQNSGLIPKVKLFIYFIMSHNL